ncbi:MAG: lysostaphin resistance A-like protein [Planctomycetota bacterium]
MPRSSPSAAADPDHGPPSYWVASKQPLPILWFLLPPIVAYEAGLALLLRSSEGVLTNKAHETLLRFFDAFGLPASGGLFLGGAAIVVVLLVWHVLTREAWRLDLATPGIMAVESLALTVPLIVMGVVIGSSSVAAAPGGGAGPTDLTAMSIWERVAIVVGGGLYEELLFRMLLIAILHTLLVDVGKLRSATGAGIAIVVSAIAFTVYHPLADPNATDAGLSVRRIAFYFLAGLYFGAVYVVRGFGIVVGTHALYDILVVTLLSGAADG